MGSWEPAWSIDWYFVEEWYKIADIFLWYLFLWYLFLFYIPFIFQLPSGHFHMAMENGRFIDDLPINMVIFHSYVQLPEGKTPINATNSHQGLNPLDVLRSYSWSTEQQRWCCRSCFHEHRGRKIDADIVMINGRLVPSPSSQGSSSGNMVSKLENPLKKNMVIET